MARLIDADALEKWLTTNKANVNPLDYNTKATYAECITMVKAMETIDAESVRHGRWVWFEDRPVTDADDPECIGCTGYECSECENNEGTCIRFYEELSPDVLARIKEGLMEFLTNYCPHCGAKMDGDLPHNVGQTTGGAEDG